MIYTRFINQTDPTTIIYDTVTDGQAFRVRYHKDTPRWSGKWYWLKMMDPDARVVVIQQFITEEEAYTAIDENVERRREELQRWVSVTEDEVNGTATPAEEEPNVDDTPF